LFDEEKIKPKKIYFFGIPQSLMKLYGRDGGLDDSSPNPKKRLAETAGKI
jgi:hypothetical protein